MTGTIERSARHMLDDWLTLHGITADDCERLLSRIPGQPTISTADFAASAQVPSGHSAEEAWTFVNHAMARQCPSLSDVIKSVVVNTAVNPAPDRKRFPAPFTLHDGGNGYPYVSCHHDGGIGSLICLAHEAGHAIQSVMSGGAFVPPITREVAAFVSETACEALIDAECSGLSPAIGELRTALDARYLGRYARRLRKALSSAQENYDYVWNYPLARLLARGLTGPLACSECTALFSGRLPLRELAERVLRP